MYTDLDDEHFEAEARMVAVIAETARAQDDERAARVARRAAAAAARKAAPLE